MKPRRKTNACIAGRVSVGIDIRVSTRERGDVWLEVSSEVWVRFSDRVQAILIMYVRRQGDCSTRSLPYNQKLRLW